MALQFEYSARTITVPKADLTLVAGTLYDMDTNAFRREVISVLGSEVGMFAEDAIRHNTEVTVAGTTFARTIELINGWSITLEDGQYTVRLVGSNNNIFDVFNGILNQNQVQVIAQNSAGLQIVSTGSVVTDQDKTDIAALVNENPRLIDIDEATSITIPDLITGQDIPSVVEIATGVWEYTRP